ncbi:hypothetical protein I2486_14620 [Cellulophaga sp. E16_2]|uniref:Uncharacterized protein n=1 Tax=Cellulophaga algicola (strain DSM 14237 / IC166 / ACAM 630) TaxID=688270 RepID=E6XEE4_CELAD|nr:MULTISPECIES: hypothetical protein [Cellulophaga]ADV50234.1 hypothetical protein Celal_2958 [Cellulophaga algicola DSM 14237]MBO0592635.1 hypothetical protein [Cellulophaga sp. E16_2]
MKFFRNRPKGDFIENGNLQELYILTEHWKSDLLFYRDDLKFLRHLEDKYFLWIKAQTDLENIRKAGESILKDTRDCDDLLERVDQHLVQLSVLINETEKHNQKEFRTEHMELEETISQFIENTRENRRQLFKVIEFDVETNTL